MGRRRETIQKTAEVAKENDDSKMDYVDAYIHRQHQKRNDGNQVPHKRTKRDETQVGFK